MWHSLPPISDQNIRNFTFPVSELNRCSREAVDDKCICGYSPPEALSPDMAFKLFTIKISTLLQLQLCPAYSSVYAKNPELLNYISYNLNSQIKYWNQTQIKSQIKRYNNDILCFSINCVEWELNRCIENWNEFSVRTSLNLPFTDFNSNISGKRLWIRFKRIKYLKPVLTH